MMIKAVLFDAGGVYLKGTFPEFVHTTNKILGLKGREKPLYKDLFDNQLGLGKITPEEAFMRFFDVHISDKQMKKIKRAWLSNWVLDKNMFNLAKRLKKNYRIAIISNSENYGTEYYLNKGWYNIFDMLFLSHEIGFSKPGREIFEYALKELGLKPEECLFIDDRNDHIATAESLGFVTILFKSVAQMKKDMKKMGIKF